MRKRNVGLVGFEILEDRMLLTGNVTVSLSSSNELRVTGDGAANEVTITEVVDEFGDPQLEITGQNDTQIHLANNSVTQAAFQVNDEFDVVTIDPSVLGNPLILRVDLGAGNNILYVDGIGTQVEEEATDVSLRATLGSGYNQLYIGANQSSVIDNLQVGQNGTGKQGDLVSIQYSTMNDGTLINLSKKSGEEDIYATDTDFSGDVQLYLGLGYSVVDFEGGGEGGGYDSLIDGNLFIYGSTSTAKTNSANISIVDMEITQSTVVDLTKTCGSDSVYASSSIFDKGVSVTTGSGNDSVTTEDSIYDRSLTVVLGAGNDNAYVLSNTFYGAVSVDGGTGKNFVYVDGYNDFFSTVKYKNVTVLPY